MMTLAGIPAFYIHSLLATRNHVDGVAQTGMPRSINRRKWSARELNMLLAADTHHARILCELKRRICIRRSHPAFRPHAPQKILDYGPTLFAVARGKAGELLSIANLSPRKRTLPATALPDSVQHGIDLLSDPCMGISAEVDLEPYQTVWLTCRQDTAIPCP
jgi:sucrose phosphorylase